MLFIKAFTFIIFLNVVVCARPSSEYISILMRKPTRDDKQVISPTTDLLRTLVKERSINRPIGYLKAMNKSNLEQLPDLMDGARRLVSLWVSDLDENKTNPLFDVTKSLDGFEQSKDKSVCTFCIYNWANFLLASIIIKLIWSFIYYFLKFFSFSLVDLL